MSPSDQNDSQDRARRRTNTNNSVEPGDSGVFRTEHLECENDDGDLDHTGEEDDAVEQDEDDSGAGVTKCAETLQCHLDCVLARAWVWDRSGLHSPDQDGADEQEEPS